MLYLLGQTLIPSPQTVTEQRPSQGNRGWKCDVHPTAKPTSHRRDNTRTRSTPKAPLQAHVQRPHKNKEGLGLSSHTSHVHFWTEESVLLLLEQDLYFLQAGNPLEATGCSTEQRTPLTLHRPSAGGRSCTKDGPSAPATQPRSPGPLCAPGRGQRRAGAPQPANKLTQL